MSPLVLQGIASGIVTGCVYALIALSLVIVYKSSDVINFAGGEMVMLGGYLGMFALLWLGLPYLLIFLFGALVIFVVGALFDRVVLTRVLGRSMPGQSMLVAMVIGTVGLSYVLKGAVRVVPYTEEVRRLPPFSSGQPIFIGPVVLQHQDIAIVLAAIVIMAALWAFFSFTMIGKALRATSQNPRAAALVGIPVRVMSMTAWGLAAALAGVAGILLAPKLLITPDMGVDRHPRARGRDHRRLHQPARLRRRRHPARRGPEPDRPVRLVARDLAGAVPGDHDRAAGAAAGPVRRQSHRQEGVTCTALRPSRAWRRSRSC